MKTIALALTTLLFSSVVLATEVGVRAGKSDSIFASNSVVDASVMWMAVDSEDYSLKFGIMQRPLFVDLFGNEEVVVEVPDRTTFVGIDYLAHQNWGNGWSIREEIGMWLFDKANKQLDGTIWKFHFSLGAHWKGDVITFVVQADHISNGDEVVGSPGPNTAHEFWTFGFGVPF